MTVAEIKEHIDKYIIISKQEEKDYIGISQKSHRVQLDQIKQMLDQLESRVEMLDRIEKAETLDEGFKRVAWEIAEENHELRYKLDQLDEWIDVNDRLPSDREQVLVSDGNHIWLMRYAEDLYRVDKYDFAEYKNQNGFYDYDSEFGYYKFDGVVAWKPIKPFKSKE